MILAVDADGGGTGKSKDWWLLGLLSGSQWVDSLGQPQPPRYLADSPRGTSGALVYCSVLKSGWLLALLFFLTTVLVEPPSTGVELSLASHFCQLVQLWVPCLGQNFGGRNQSQEEMRRD